MADNVIMNPIPILYNSKKISELRGRDSITEHQDHSWIVIAQYNSLLGSYHNIAMNLKAITSYAIENSYQSTDYVIKTEMRNFINDYNIAYLRDFAYVFIQSNEETSYILSYSELATNVVSYINSYTMDCVMWDHFPSHDIILNSEKYLATETRTHILTENNKKILV